jgi:hypothetical protein
MIPHLVLWLCVILPHLWPRPPRGRLRRPAEPLKRKRKHTSAPKPFAGLTQKPPGALCEQVTVTAGIIAVIFALFSA